MGKRSQALGRWLTSSQRGSRGSAQSGARIWVVLSKAQKRERAEQRARAEDLANMSQSKIASMRGVTIVPEAPGTAHA